MEVGSIVKCIKLSSWSRAYSVKVNIPKVKGIYTVRGFYNNTGDNAGRISIYLEEIINDKLPITDNVEPSFEIEIFEELLPPMNILEKIEESNLIEA